MKTIWERREKKNKKGEGGYMTHHEVNKKFADFSGAWSP